jgi:hypothetical protein
MLLRNRSSPLSAILLLPFRKRYSGLPESARKLKVQHISESRGPGLHQTVPIITTV